jgi:glutaredoxin 3
MNSTMDKQVTIYSTPSCHFCHAAKAYFDEKGVKYEDFNVLDNMEKRQEMIDMTGQMGVPVIRIGDDVVVGFDQPMVEKLLS